IQAGGPGEVAEQGPRILTRLRPLMVGEELVVHLPELSLLAPALRGKRGVARVLVAGEREIAIAPAHLSGGDELLADHRHLHGRAARRPRRCGGSRRAPACRTSLAPHNGTARCARCPAVSAIRARDRAAGPSRRVPGCARPTRAASLPDAGPAPARRPGLCRRSCVRLPTVRPIASRTPLSLPPPPPSDYTTLRGPERCLLGEPYCAPVVGRRATVGANA